MGAAPYREGPGGHLPEETAHAYGDVYSPDVFEMLRDIQVSVEVLVYPERPGDTERCKFAMKEGGGGSVPDYGIG